MNFEEKELENQKIGLIKHKCKVNEVRGIIDKLIEWASKNNLQIVGSPFAIYYTNPSKIPFDEIVYEVGIPIIGNPDQEDNIKIRYIPEHFVISTIHEGKYSALSKTHMKLLEYIFKNDYEIDGFPRELYLNNPDEVYEEELLTEIQFPVKKLYHYNPEGIPEEKVLEEIQISKKT